MLSLLALFVVAVVAEEEIVNLGDLPMQNPDLFEGDIIGIDPNIDRNAIPSETMKWPSGTVPYVIDATLTSGASMIQAAMNDYHQKTCIKFVARTGQPNYIHIFSGDGCYSNVGMIRGKQMLSLGRGCLHTGTIVHELGHAIGFYHEQNRSDRDDYLIIHWSNIQSGMENQFTKLAPHQNQLLSPFDGESIMCYGNTAFSKDGRSTTMSTKTGTKLRETYEKPGLNPSDVIRIKKLYRC